jgi:hypothetical protein
VGVTHADGTQSLIGTELAKLSETGLSVRTGDPPRCGLVVDMQMLSGGSETLTWWLCSASL